VLGCGPLQRAAAARWGRVQRAAQAVVTGEHEGRATGGRRENAVYSTYPLVCHLPDERLQRHWDRGPSRARCPTPEQAKPLVLPSLKYLRLHPVSA